MLQWTFFGCSFGILKNNDNNKTWNMQKTKIAIMKK